MTHAERNKLKKYFAEMSSEQLENKFWDTLYHDVLGSQAELMEEAGYEPIDVQERRKIEKDADESTDLMQAELAKRGIDVWARHTEETEKNK